LLTGTPLQNNMSELWALLHYLLPELFATTLDFQSWFLEPLRGVKGLVNEYEVSLRPQDEEAIISRLHMMLCPFLLQRTKKEVLSADKLPPRVESSIRVELSAWQLAAYRDLEKKTIQVLSAEGEQRTEKMNNVLMQLRKITLHPYLFLDQIEKGPNLFRVSGKLEVLDRMLPKLLQFGHKTLIFSQFTSVLDVLGAYLEWKGILHGRLDGQTAHEERRNQMQTFSKQDGPDILLLSARAGGLGLNLQAADTVVLFDLDWNPQNDKQAIARAHRMGQTREVRVFRLITASRVEAHMERRCEEKLDLERKIIGAGAFHKAACHEARRDHLRSILGIAVGGASVGGSEQQQVATTSPSELNKLLARSPEELESFEAMDAELLGPVGARAEPLLVKAGRLMREDEVPKGFQVSEE